MKILGLFVAFNGLQGSLRIFEVLSRVGFTADSLFGLGLFSSLLILVLGIAIWSRAAALAPRFLTTTDGSEEVASGSENAAQSVISVTQILTLAVAILGIYLLSQAMVHGITGIGLWVRLATVTAPSAILSSGFEDVARREVFSAAGYLIAGSILTFGARRIGALIGRDRKESPEL